MVSYRTLFIATSLQYFALHGAELKSQWSLLVNDCALFQVKPDALWPAADPNKQWNSAKGGALKVREMDYFYGCNVLRVTTCLENLEMSGNLKHVREMSGMLLTVREMSRKKSCHGKVTQNCSLLDEYLHSYGLLCT